MTDNDYAKRAYLILAIWKVFRFPFFWVFVTACLLPSLVWADQNLSILTPPGCLPADGGPWFPIYIYTWGKARENRSTLRIRADLGKFQPAEILPGGLIRAQYIPPKIRSPRTIRFIVSYRDAGRIQKKIKQVSLCPHPAGKIWIRTNPKKLLAGKQEKSVLSIQAVDVTGKPLEGLQLEITTNVGRVSKLTDLGKGEYKAYFHPPDDPYPQVAIIMVANPRLARLDRIAVGRVVIPITARIELPGETSPHTSMQLVVAGKRFGPVHADQQGHFRIPILVPPGYGKAKATSIDRVGNRGVQWIDLFLPETNQLGLWGYPRLLPADGRSRSRLLVTTIDPYGVAADFSLVSVRAKCGQVGAIKNIGRGFYEAYYTASNSVGIGVDVLEVRLPGGGHKSRATFEMQLLPGPADQISIDVPKILPADGQVAGKVTVHVQDARGNPVGGQQVSLTASVGRLAELQELSTGRFETSLIIPSDVTQWTSTIRTKALDQVAGTPEGFLIVPESLVTGSDGRRYLVPVLVDRIGRPVEGAQVELRESGKRRTSTTSAFGRARFELWLNKQKKPHSCLLSAHHDSVRRLVYWVEEKDTARLLPINLDRALPPDKPLEHTASVQIHPPLPVDLSLEAFRASASKDLWVIRARLTDSKGNPSAGRKLIFSTSAGELSPVKEVDQGVYQVRLDPKQVDWKRILITAMDAETRVGAIVEIVAD